MAASSSSDSDSSSSRSTSPEPDNKQKQTMKGQKGDLKSKEEVEDSSSSGSGSDSDSSDDSSDESSDDSEDANETAAPAKKVVIAGSKPYKPPSGFNSANKQAPPSSTSSSVLSNLNGKKVFHITAPSFLPLSKVKEITMSKVMKGKPILSYEGSDYGIPSEAFTEEDLQGKSLLVFDKSTQKYKKTTDHIPTYNIQELVNVPEADKETVEALRDTVKPARPQPKNLKMRFRPLGSLPATPETLGSDSESEAEVPSFKVPAGEKERKRKHDRTEGEASQTVSSPSRKKSKKHSAPEDGEEKSHKKSKKSKDGEEKKRKKSKA
ncbi:hypothetical protein N7478_009580 [Penicillium angulare]|uniref:uncharacterized protein n=1 Tax=Penicillium angulare TaxID=116970 RepID=UPI00254265C2|nr:uncharacterized protein N7478_009580 [Penicillium angulare]KAJ5266772.1 hypothetical protein N7478_009580 [Penicillium angulare]